MNTTTTTASQYCIKCHKYWGSEARKWYCSVCFKEEEKNLKLQNEKNEKNEEKPKESEKIEIESKLEPERPVQVITSLTVEK